MAGPAAVGLGSSAGGVVAVAAGVVTVAVGAAGPASVTLNVVLVVASPSTHSTATRYSPGSNPVVSTSNDQVFAVAFPSWMMTVPDVPSTPPGADAFVGSNPIAATVTSRRSPAAMFVVPLIVRSSPAETSLISLMVISCAAAVPQIHAASTRAIVIPASLLVFILFSPHPPFSRGEIRVSEPGRPAGRSRSRRNHFSSP